jgi:lysozyme family protein
MTAISPVANRSAAAGSGFKIGDVTLAKLGSRGTDVRLLQEKLKAAGMDPGPLDGVFGPKTLAAVKAFQSAKGLQHDGIAGQQTWGALHGLSYPPGSNLLKKGASQPVAGAHGHSHESGFQDPALGNGKQVQAYVNGRPSNITVHDVGNGQFMRADAGKAFKAMQQAARAAGVNLSATSGFRTHAQQQALYQKYLNGTGNLAAKPGYSNHQNGISMDVGGINGYGTAAYSWMKANAGKYGFVNDVAGEFWHWTYKR